MRAVVALLVATSAMVCLADLFRDPPPIPPPVLHPRKPAPNWSWDTLPIAFHGANKTGMFNSDAIEQLAKYNMVTIEKWYTPCGAQGPTQAGPECDVEDKMFDTFHKIKAINPAVTTIMYLNSMFDFAFYNLHGKMEAREAAGQQSFLRDRHGNIVSLVRVMGLVYLLDTLLFPHAHSAMTAMFIATSPHSITQTKRLTNFGPLHC
jgi:hypothetical protein